MTLQDFAKMTIKVIHEDGLEGYLPTFVLPDTQQIRAIEGIPADVDHRDAVQNVVRRSGYETREFFFGVQSAPQQISRPLPARPADRVYEHHRGSRRLFSERSWGLRLVESMTVWPNQALQRTRHSVVVCNSRVPRAGSLSLGR